MSDLFPVHVNIFTSTRSVSAHHGFSKPGVSEPLDSLYSLEKRLQRQIKFREDLLDTAITNGDSTSIEIILQYTNPTTLYPIFPEMSTLPIRRRKKIRALKQILHQQRALSIFRLFKAAHDGDVEICKLLIRYDVNVNSTYCEQSHLYAACKNGQYLCVSVLLENGADVNAGDLYNGITPFLASVIVPTLLQHSDEFVFNRLNCIDLLRSYNADVNQTNYYGNTALVASAWSHRLSKYLLTIGCLPDVMSDSGAGSALHSVWCQRSPHIMEMFLDAGANVDASNEFGRTSLSLACRRQDRCCVELLLNYNADLHVPHDNNLSILQMAHTQLALHGVSSTHDVWKMILNAEQNRLQTNATDWIRLARLDRHKNPQAAGRQSQIVMGTARQRRRRQL